MRYLIVSCVFGISTLITPSAWGQAKNPLMGAWKVTEIGNPKGEPLTNPQPGLYLFTEKHYSAVRLNGTKPLPQYQSNDVATEAEKVASFDTIYVNTGSYTLDGDKLTLSPQVAKSAFAMVPGRTLNYEISLAGNMLTLVQKPAGPVLKFVRVE